MDSENKPEKHHQHPQKSPTELFSSAKIVADAAFGGGSEKSDKGRAAEAAADLLDAAERYGNLDKSSYGKYVDKAEDYLHKYSTTHSTTTTTTPGGGTTTTVTDTATHTASRPEGKSGDDKEESGVGDYFKMAQGFLGK